MFICSQNKQCAGGILSACTSPGSAVGNNSELCSGTRRPRGQSIPSIHTVPVATDSLFFEEPEELDREKAYSSVPQWPPPETSGWRVCAVGGFTRDCIDGPEVVECTAYKVAHERLATKDWGPVILQGLVGLVQGNQTPETLCYSLALFRSGTLAVYYEQQLVRDQATPVKQWRISDIKAKSADNGRTLQIWEKSGAVREHFHEFVICSGPSGRTWQNVIAKHGSACSMGSSPFDADTQVF